MNKKILIPVIIIIILVILAVVWFFFKDSFSSNTNQQTVNSTNVPSNANVSGIPQSEEYIFIFGAEPSTGASAGGDTITLRGSGFVDGLKVFFGDAEASNIKVTDSKTMTVTTPSGSGTVNVKITNPDNRSSVLYDGFAYN